MLKLRLKRAGRKKQPFYKVVVIDSKSRRDGFAVEEVGFYNPMTKALKLNGDRILIRLKQGVQPTRVVTNLLKKASIVN